MSSHNVSFQCTSTTYFLVLESVLRRYTNLSTPCIYEASEPMKSSSARNRLRILYFRTALQGITVYIVRNIAVRCHHRRNRDIYVEKIVIRRHATSRGCVGGNRAKIVGWPTRGIDLPSWWRANRDHVDQSRNSATKEERKPNDFRHDFFATIFSHATVPLIPLPPSSQRTVSRRAL